METDNLSVSLDVKSIAGSANPIAELLAPGMYFVLRGEKVIKIHDKIYRLERGMCAVNILPTPSISHVAQPAPEDPYVEVVISLNPNIINIVALSDNLQINYHLGGFMLSHFDDAISNIIESMIDKRGGYTDYEECSDNMSYKLYSLMLRGPFGGALAQISHTKSHLAQIRDAVGIICSDLDKPLRIGALADKFEMTHATFAYNFKRLTGFSPVMYRKHVRLIEARRFLLSQDISVVSTISRFGYASSSHFNRDYKRLFGSPPFRDIKKDTNAFKSRLYQG